MPLLWGHPDGFPPSRKFVFSLRTAAVAAAWLERLAQYGEMSFAAATNISKRAKVRAQ